jgi:hypothetical protein
MTLRACHTCKHAELILVPTTCKYGLSDQVLIISLTKEPLWCAERVQSYTELSQYHCLSTRRANFSLHVLTSDVDGRFRKLSLSQLPGGLIGRSQHASYSLSLKKTNVGQGLGNQKSEYCF